MLPDFRVNLVEALHAAAMKFPLSEQARYLNVITELDKFVLVHLEADTNLGILRAMYREALISRVPALKSGTRYTHISRLNNLLKSSVVRERVPALFFESRFPKFPKLGNAADDRRLSAYVWFEAYCFKYGIEYHDVSEHTFIAFRDEEQGRVSRQMAETRYDDLRRFWLEHAVAGKLRDISIPRFDESRRTNYGIKEADWPAPWTDFFGRFRNAACGHPHSGDEPWKRHLTDGRLSVYRRNFCELLGYMLAHGYDPALWPPERVFATAGMVISFVRWHIKVRCDNRARDYHPQILKRMANLGEHFFGQKTCALELRLLADSTQGEAVRERIAFEDLSYQHLSERAFRALEQAHYAWIALPSTASVAERKSVALKFRTRLLLAWLLRRPLRASNIAAMRVGLQLIELPDGQLQIRLKAHHMKGKREWRALCPQRLLPFIKLFTREVLPNIKSDANESVLSASRSELSGDTGANPLLFPSKSGRQLSRSSLWRIVRKTAPEVLGINCSTHDFRGLVVTLYLVEFPHEYRTARDVLGHRHVETTFARYVHLTPITASRRMPAFLQASSPDALTAAEWRPGTALTFLLPGPQKVLLP